MLNFTNRQKQFAYNSLAGVALAGLILLLINGLSNWFYARWDMTAAHAYSLSPSSKKLVRSLEDPLVIKAYFSNNLPAPYNSYARYVEDILDEYKAASRGRVRYEFVRPQPLQEFEERAMQAGMAPLQFQEMGADQLQIRRGFMGLMLFYRDRSEVLPVIKSFDQLEYDLTSRIARMTRKNKKSIAVTSGHGETVWVQSQLRLAQDLPAFYDLGSPLALPSSTTAPLQADALMVVGPQQKFEDASLWAIDQAIMRGTPVLFLVDAKRFMVSQFISMPQTTGLEDLLKNYGVSLGNQLVYDAQCETVGMTQNLGGMTFTTGVRFPFVPQVTHFAKDHPVLRGIQALGVPFVTHLDAQKVPEGVRFTPLLFSSDQSWLAPETTYSVAPNAIPRPKPDEPHGPYVLAGMLEGTFPSFFAGKPSPVKGEIAIEKSAPTSLFVLSTSHILDPNLPEFPGTGALVTNALAFLTKDDTLIGIQSKGEILRPLKPLHPAVMDAVRLGCIVAVPVLPIVLGLIRWRRRKTWRRTVATGFAAPSPS